MVAVTAGVVSVVVLSVVGSSVVLVSAGAVVVSEVVGGALVVVSVDVVMPAAIRAMWADAVPAKAPSASNASSVATTAGP